jgi:hypothetical protein
LRWLTIAEGMRGLVKVEDGVEYANGDLLREMKVETVCVRSDSDNLFVTAVPRYPKTLRICARMLMG